MPRLSRTALLLLPVLALGLAACGGDDTTDPGGGGDAHPASGATCPTGSTLTYETFGRPFMTQYCTSCHSSTVTGPGRGGAPADHNYDSLAGVQRWRTDIDRWAAAGPAAVNTAMPPARPTPTEAQRQQLGEWLACGAP